MNIKSFDDLDITNPIMFGLVFSNKHIAQPFIEHLLDRLCSLKWLLISLK